MVQSTTSRATSMADLMKSAAPLLPSLKRGQIVKGVITKLTSHEILVDVNAKTEAVVLEKDKKFLRTILSSLRVGESVNVSVLNPESDMGYPVVSLRRYIDELQWKEVENALRSQKPIEILVKELTKGGYLIETASGLFGFLPNSQLTVGGEQHDLLGKKIQGFILDANRSAKKVIVSQKPVMDKATFEKITKTLTPNTKVTGTITHIMPFGMFLSISVDGISLDGLVHISELSWEKVDNISSQYSVGQAVDVIVIGFDNEAKRIDFSIKRLIQDPFEKIMKKYSIDQKVSGAVTKVNNTGVYLDLEEGVEALIKKEKIPPTKTYQEGDTVSATVSEIDQKRHRILLVPVLTEKFVGYR